ncbi:rhamnogalacturonan lyase B N-terminal domain-containing protein [Undibacterium sp. Ji49W]|uniref:rhamnogalacturonan lyase B N-terminal domain-containing protein n=1 Tax=Undibacterium sp. Ji49W TaxID=3413040 RepID=UPI003BEFB8E0
MSVFNWRTILVSLAVTMLTSACGGGSQDSANAGNSLAGKISAGGSPPPAAFGVTDSGGFLTVTSGAGLVFKVDENGGNITSIKYNDGPELQSQTKGSHIASGLGATVSYSVSGSVAKITLTTSTLIHYLLVRANENNIYMGTYVTAEPSVGELRWITRLNSTVLTNVPTESRIADNTGAIESTDIFGLANGETRSKYYGNQRAIDLSIRGVTGSNIGIFMVYGNRESSSGGPFYRDIQNQTGGDTEVYNYMNSGHNQTEADRMGFHGPYAVMFTTGATPAIPDMSWMGSYNLSGWIDASGRGKVVGNGLAGMDGNYAYTVGFANATAQYWTAASTTNGNFVRSGMKPGTYTMSVYKGELAVYTETVAVSAGGTTTLNTRTIQGDPSADTAVWRIGDWDGTPRELKNGQTFNVRHPSDVRNASWGPVTYNIGAATNSFPAAQWKDLNSPTTVTFNLSAAQVANHTVRIGITGAYAGGRPNIKINAWTATAQGASTQPNSRSLTTGSYRGNNTMYSFSVPASAFVTGTNTMTISVVSGSSGTTYLSPAFAFDALDML